MKQSAKYWENQYKEGKNILYEMKKNHNETENRKANIELSYDLQAGSYIKNMKDNNHKEHKKRYTKELAKIIKDLGEVKTVLEVGIGEATTLSGVMQNLQKSIKYYGFDLSLSRVAYAKEWLDSLSLKNYILSTGDLQNIPFLDNSIDIVYTSHSIEPNLGNEKEILEELFRVTNKYLILLEPAYELTNDENRKRMDYHGYCKNLLAISESLGYEVIKHEIFKYSVNELNPTAITIIKKCTNKKSSKLPLACPLTKTKLKKYKDCYYSDEALSVYPIINNIPCLRVENKILATKYKKFNK